MNLRMMKNCVLQIFAWFISEKFLMTHRILDPLVTS